MRFSGGRSCYCNTQVIEIAHRLDMGYYLKVVKYLMISSINTACGA
jgi:hypothetical protein